MKNMLHEIEMLEVIKTQETFHVSPMKAKCLSLHICMYIDA